MSVDVCVLQLQLVMRTMKTDHEGSRHRMDVGDDSTMVPGGRL